MSKISRWKFTVKAAMAGVLGLGGCASSLRQNPDGIKIDERTETETASPLVNYIVYHDGDWIVEFENQGVEGRLNTMLFECEEGKFEHDMKIHTADFCSEVHRTTHFVDPEETVKIERDFPVERQDNKEYVTGVYPGTIVRTLRCTNRGGTVTAQLYERPEYGSTEVA